MHFKTFEGSFYRDDPWNGATYDLRYGRERPINTWLFGGMEEVIKNVQTTKLSFRY